MGFLWKQRKFPRWRKTWGLENQTGVKNRAKQKISWMISHSGAPPIAMVALFRSLSFWWHWPRWLAGVCVPLSDRYRIIIWSLSDYPLSNTSPMRSHVVKMSTSLTWHHSLRAYILKESPATSTGPQKNWTFRKFFQKCHEMAQKWPKMAQSGTNMTQNGPKMPKTAQEWPKWPKNDSHFFRNIFWLKR